MKNNKKKNVLIIGSSQGAYGGIEAFMIALAKTAATWEEFNIVLCFKLVKGAKLTYNLKLLAEKDCKTVYYVNRASWQLMKLINWSDVIHLQNMPPDVIFPARILFKKVYLTVHNRKHLTNAHSIIWDLAIKFAQKRWFISSFVWNSWEGNNKSSKSECVPSICNLPKKITLPEDRKGFLFVGRWIPNKGIEEILQAYALNNFNPNIWPLTILGDGPLKPTILGLIQELGLQSVNMPGFVDESIKENYLSSARWLLAPANTQEDLGLTPIEARSVGVPSIVSRDGGLPESAGDAALITEPGNVEDLAKFMLVAATMNNEEYKQRSESGMKSLTAFLKPMEFYRAAYNN